MFHPDLLSRLRCPQCKQAVEHTEHALLCQSGHRTPTTGGFVDVRPSATDEITRQTLESFGYEWTIFPRIESEDEASWEVYLCDVRLDQLEDAIALDAGCGRGRFSYFLAPPVRASAALDASAAIEAATVNLAAQPSVTLLRCDLREVAFRRMPGLVA